MKKKLLIFTGAGFSKSLANDLPTTKELFDSALAEKIVDANYLNCLKEILGGGADIEVVAQKTARMISGLKGFASDNADNPPVSMQIAFRNIPLISGSSGQGVSRLEKYLESINEHVISKLDCTAGLGDNSPKNQSAIRKNIERCGTFLKGLGNNFELKVFSTNYDNLIRHLHPNKRYYIVGEPGVSPSVVDISKLIGEGDPYSYIPLKGMVDWRRSGDKIIEGHSYEGNYQNKVIMPLEDISTPEASPHREMYAELRKETRESHVLLFIGFSFRDEFINELLRNNHSAVVKSERVIIVTGSANSPSADAFKQHIETNVFTRIAKAKISYIGGGFTRDAQRSILTMFSNL